MEITLSVAGKTFLAGEYLALHGGPALVAATGPRFEMKIVDNKNAFVSDQLHADSPAGKLLQKQADFFQQYSFQMKDPYQTGGFGASTAQFVLLHALWQLRGQVFTETERFFDWHEMINDYRELAFQGKGFPPSGADLVGMCRGGLTWFERNTGNMQSFAWPFQDIDFMIVKTPFKLATHEHLATLSSFDSEALSRPMHEIREALVNIDTKLFLQGMRVFRQLIESNGWVADQSKVLLGLLENHSEILFAKGCGAMGADVLLLLFERKNFSAVQKIAGDLGLLVRGTSADLSRGIDVFYPASDKENNLI